MPGRIVKVLDRGVIVDLDGEVEGFVPTAQLGYKELAHPAAAFKAGGEMPLQVTELEQSQRKIVLSVSAYFKKRDKSEFEEFLAKHPVTAMPGEPKPAAAKTKSTHHAKPVSAEAEAPETDESAGADVVSKSESVSGDIEETEQL